MKLIKKEGKLVVAPLGDLPEIRSPYSRDILLFNTNIAGTVYIDDIEEIVESFMEDEEFSFFREINNIHDEKAIVVKNKHDKKVGYIPKADNIIFARLLDAGKLLFGRLKEHEVKGRWHKINIDIYLRDN